MQAGTRTRAIGRCLSAFVFVALAALLFAAPCAAQVRMMAGQDDPIPADAELKAAAVDSVSWALNKTYVFEDVAKEMEKHLSTTSSAR